MGRLIAFILGGAAIVFFGAYLLPPGDFRSTVVGLWEGADFIDEYFLERVRTYGAGVVAGIALLLFAIRGSHE